MSTPTILEDWTQRCCVLATMHQKERVIVPLLSQGLGMNVSVPADFDTDQFGTFARDIARPGDQLATARKKALAAMKLTGTDLGIASEGSFGIHPALPFVRSNFELVVLIDTKHAIEIVGHYRTSAVPLRTQTVSTVADAVATAEAWGFPAQGVIVRTSSASKRHIYKDLETLDELSEVSRTLLSKWFVPSIFLETDMRAHRCPARLESIASATSDLIQNCKHLCPRCQTPGFVVTSVLAGLPCRACGRATDLPKEVVRSCQKCSHEEPSPASDTTTTDPGQCEWCNP